MKCVNPPKYCKWKAVKLKLRMKCHLFLWSKTRNLHIHHKSNKKKGIFIFKKLASLCFVSNEIAIKMFSRIASFPLTLTFHVLWVLDTYAFVFMFNKWAHWKLQCTAYLKFCQCTMSSATCHLCHQILHLPAYFFAFVDFFRVELYIQWNYKHTT